jgi:hypothetical protein
VTTSRARTGFFGCGAIALIMLASACSSGSEKLSVGPTTTRAPHASSASDATSATEKRSTTTAKMRAKTRATTSTTRGRTSARGTLGPTTTNGSSVYVPLGNTTAPTTATPTTATPTTASRPPTTVGGPKPYDPSKPIDLSGTPGVTPAEQARAEQLVRDTLRDLPHYADPNTAFSEGYRSIGDAVTGDEHYVKWAYLSDGHILDSKHPESLVYEMRNGRKTLVAAMYTLNVGDTFADVPDIGGPLTQWHVHNDLCLADDPTDPLRKVVSSLTTATGTCPAGTTKAGSVPMIHVWIVKNACGPFASLEGIGAGQVPPGQTRNCDTAHGSH